MLQCHDMSHKQSDRIQTIDAIRTRAKISMSNFSHSTDLHQSLEESFGILMNDFIDKFWKYNDDNVD